VNKTAPNAPEETNQPKHQQNYKNRPQHRKLSFVYYRMFDLRLPIRVEQCPCQL
jgi:hypothetical protein